MAETTPKEPRTVQQNNSLASLQAIALAANNPQMMNFIVQEAASKRRALEAEILDERRMAAQEALQEDEQAFQAAESAAQRELTRSEGEAGRELQSKQFQKSYEQGQRQLDLSEEQFRYTKKRGQQEIDLARKRLGLSEREFEEGTRRWEKEYGLTERKFIADTTDRAVQRLMPLLASMGDKAGAMSLKDLGANIDMSKAAQPQLMAAFAEKDPKKRAEALYEVLWSANQAKFMAAAATNGGDEGSAQEMARALAEGILNTLDFDVLLTPGGRFEALRALLQPEPAQTEAARKIAAGQVGAMTPEELTDWTTTTGKDLAKDMISGKVWSMDEQKLMGMFLNDVAAEPEKKAEAIRAMLDIAMKEAAMELELDAAETVTLMEQAYATMEQMVEMGEDWESHGDMLLQPAGGAIERAEWDLRMLAGWEAEVLQQPNTLGRRQALDDIKKAKKQMQQKLQTMRSQAARQEELRFYRDIEMGRKRARKAGAAARQQLREGGFTGGSIR